LLHDAPAPSRAATVARAHPVPRIAQGEETGGSGTPFDARTRRAIDSTTRVDVLDTPWQQAAPLTTVVLDNATLSRLGGATLLARLAGLSDQQIAHFATEYPEQLAALLRFPPPAPFVTDWWRGLTAEAMLVLTNGVPELVGNLDGIPFRARDFANRIFLARSMERLSSSRASKLVGKSTKLSDHRHRETLSKIEKSLGGDDAVPHRLLITLDTSTNVRAAIALGDLDSADYVSYIVPGMFFSVDLRMIDLSDIAARLYDHQASFLKAFGSASPQHGLKTVATIAWIGYDTPNLLTVGGLDLARQAATNLERALLGLKSVRAANPPSVTVIGHSYGSTAALLALQNGRASVNALALVGSPGSSAQSASQLAVENGNVYVGKAGLDPIVNSAFYGSDPGASAYGAKTMSVSGGFDPLTKRTLSGSLGHNEYFKPDSESLRNLALIGIGGGKFVTNGSEGDSTKTLALLK